MRVVDRNQTTQSFKGHAQDLALYPKNSRESLGRECVKQGCCLCFEKIPLADYEVKDRCG